MIERELDRAYRVIHIAKVALVGCASLVLTFHLHPVLDRFAIYLNCDGAFRRIPTGEGSRFQNETCLRVFGTDP